MPNPVVHFEINARDGAAMQQYYGDLFAWKIDASNPMNYGLVDTDAGGEGIMGGIGPSEDGSVSTLFYVQVPDVQAALDRAVSLGGSVVRPMEVIPGMVTMAVFADPEGNQVGLVAEQTPATE